MNKEFIKQILIDQRNSILLKRTFIERDCYKEVIDKLHLPHVQVLTGLRRSGKSSLMRQIIHNHFSEGNFYYINFEDERLIDFSASNFYIFHEALIELFGNQTTFFLDEVQNIKGFESFVRRLTEEGNKFIITGSNANLLSSEIATKLTGRHIDTFVPPFTFKEFLRYKNVEVEPTSIYDTQQRIQLKVYFDEYTKQGGMPEYTIYREPEILSRTYEDIVLKDIAVRYKVENTLHLRELYRFIITNHCQLFSFNSLTKSSQYASPISIQNYVNYLENTYFIYTIQKFDYSLKKQQVSEKKAYVLDTGFIQYITTKHSSNSGWLLENIVANVLRTQGKIYYYKNKKECDFIFEKNNQLELAIQVCFELNESNKSREFDGLIAAMNEFAIPNGTILTHDQEENVEYQGKSIKVVPVWKWVVNHLFMNSELSQM